MVPVHLHSRHVHYLRIPQARPSSSSGLYGMYWKVITRVISRNSDGRINRELTVKVPEGIVSPTLIVGAIIEFGLGMKGLGLRNF